MLELTVLSEIRIDVKRPGWFDSTTNFLYGFSEEVEDGKIRVYNATNRIGAQLIRNITTDDLMIVNSNIPSLK